MKRLVILCLLVIFVLPALTLLIGCRDQSTPAQSETSEPPPTLPSETSEAPSDSASLTPAISHSASFSDSTDDLFDSAGEATTDEPYLDITEVELTLTKDGYYRAKIEVNGPLPTKIDDASVFVEWAILVDADCDRTSGWNWPSPLVCNDIGPDYLLRLELTSSQYKGSVFDKKALKWRSTEYDVDGNKFELAFSSEAIGSPDDFNYVIAVRKYGGGRQTQDTLISAERAPNLGHYRFLNGHEFVDFGFPIALPDTDEDGFGDDEESCLWGTEPEVAERWDNLDTVTGILNTPEKIALYLKREFLQVQKPSQPFAVPVTELFTDKSGDCDEYAILATYWLAENGYEAYVLKVHFNIWWQEYDCWRVHDICIYKGNDGLWHSIDIYFHESGDNPVGPFNSIEEICDTLPPHYSATDWIEYDLYDINGKSIQTVTK